MLLLAAVLVPFLPAAVAWGTLGHQTAAFVAQDFVSSTTKTWAQGILGNTNSSYLASIATWADSYRYTSAGTFSAPYHYLDALDSPPSSCNVNLTRDCGAEGCVVTAIANYSHIVNDGRYSATNHKQALEFLVHFIADVSQPLHNEAAQVGGNDVSVVFNGKTTNLHHIWDTEIPEKSRGGYALADARAWATELTTAIKTGKYAAQSGVWLDGIDVKDAQASALVWSKDANTFVCSNALADGVSSVQGKELNGTYYQTNAPIVETQIAKAGYRLAAWLNLLHDGTTGV